MTTKVEKSPAGIDILRHEAPEARSFEPAHGNEVTVSELVEHVEAHFGKVAFVWHEIISDRIHVDVHVVKPTPERDYFTLFTTGMSDLPMTAPEGAEDYRHAELLLHLPSDWPLAMNAATTDADAAESWYWPIRWLKQLARFPHEFDTWLGMGHTIPNGDPPQPFRPDTKLCSWLLLPPLSVEAPARSKRLSDGRTVHLYVLHGLTLEELNLKLNKGSDALLDLLDTHALSEVLTPGRRPMLRKKLFGLF